MENTTKNTAKLIGNTVKNTILTHVTNKSFYLGIVLAIGMFSQYIFGSDNLTEQAAEFINKAVTGRDVDFSKELKANTTK